MRRTTLAGVSEEPKLATVVRLHPDRDAPEIDEVELVARARRQDPAALRALFELHKDRVSAQLLRMTGDPTAVDDLVQEVFISAFTNLHKFRGDSQLHTWLYRIGANKARNWWDSTRRRRRRERRAAEALPPASDTPHDRLEHAEHHAKLYAALGQLSPKLREAFVARIIEGLSLAETSAALGVPISTVSYRTRRAEALLCKALDIPIPDGGGR